MNKNIVELSLSFAGNFHKMVEVELTSSFNTYSCVGMWAVKQMVGKYTVVQGKEVVVTDVIQTEATMYDMFKYIIVFTVRGEVYEMGIRYNDAYNHEANLARIKKARDERMAQEEQAYQEEMAAFIAEFLG